MTRSEKIAAKKIDKRIEAAFYANFNGVQVSVLDIPKIFRVGREALALGADELGLIMAMRGFIDTVRKN